MGEPCQGDVGGTLGGSPRCRGNLGRTLRSTFLKDFLGDVGGPFLGGMSGEPAEMSGEPLGNLANGARNRSAEAPEPGSAAALFEIQGKGTETLA